MAHEFVDFVDSPPRTVAPYTEQELVDNKSRIEDLIDFMKERVEKVHRVGLALPQVILPPELRTNEESTENRALFIALDVDSGLFKAYINPKVTYSQEQKSEVDFEGCLSVPSITIGNEEVENPQFLVERRRTGKIESYDLGLKGRVQTHFSGLNGLFIAHEYDHVESTPTTVLDRRVANSRVYQMEEVRDEQVDPVDEFSRLLPSAERTSRSL